MKNSLEEAEIIEPAKKESDSDLSVLTATFQEEKVKKVTIPPKDKSISKDILLISFRKKKWSQEEDKLLFQLYKQNGACWAKIASYIGGRSESDVKNRFYSTLRRVSRKIGGFKQPFTCSKSQLIKFVDIALASGHFCYSKRGRKNKSLENSLFLEVNNAEKENITKGKMQSKTKRIEKLTKKNIEDLKKFSTRLLSKLGNAKLESASEADSVMEELTKIQEGISLLLEKTSNLVN